MRYALPAAGLVWLAFATIHAQQPVRPASPPDAIVIGAGLAGLSAAVEMGRAGVRVLVLDMNSVPGGHAVLAGGVTIVDTPVQARAGITDSPDLAYRDWMAWTVDADPWWTRFYAERSRAMIYDWATALGVDFVRASAADGNSVPRFHFTRGRALHLVLPIFRAAQALPPVSFLWNTTALRLVVEGERVHGVVVRHLREGREETIRAPHVVVATGGFESDLRRVLDNWTPGLPRPDRLLIGSAISATGSGHDMATAAGAALRQPDRHYIYIDGLVDPRDPDGIHALTAGNEAAIWVNAQGRRFTNEAGFDKQILVDLLRQRPTTYWAIFDEAGRRQFSVRGAAWLNTPSDGHPILDNPASVKKAASIEALAAASGLPHEALATSVHRFNAHVARGHDEDFERFGPGGPTPAPILQPPFYAVQLHPMTRKNMGGLAIDEHARVMDTAGRTIPGLYAAGEVTGSVGINGRHGMDGMFLGPAIVTGRLAGQAVAAAVSGRTAASPTSDTAPATGVWRPVLDAEALKPLLATSRDGYWHFEKVHATVLERRYACTMCHSAAVPMTSIASRVQRTAQLALCTHCH